MAKNKKKEELLEQMKAMQESMRQLQEDAKKKDEKLEKLKQNSDGWDDFAKYYVLSFLTGGGSTSLSL